MDKKNTTININISSFTMVKVIIVLLGLYFLYLIKDILVILFVALIFSSAIGPWVDWMQTKKIPRPMGMISIYLILFGTIGSTIYLIIPPIVSQLNDLSVNFPAYFEDISSPFSAVSAIKEYTGQHEILSEVKTGLSAISNSLDTSSSKIFSTAFGIFGGIVSFFLVLVITFYMAVEENAMKKIVWSTVPDQYQPYVLELINRMQRKIGLWLRGQLILSLIIFALTFIGLSILKVKYALVLALIAGITEFVPYLGPILAAIPAVFLAFTQSPNLALFVVILYYIIQWTENNIVVPKLMQKVVGLNPIVIIVVLLVGFKLAGIMGAILSIPVATAGSVFVKDIFDKKITPAKS